VIFHDVRAEKAVDVPAIVLAVNEAPAPDTAGPSLELGVFSSWGYGYVAGVFEGPARGQWSWPRRIPEVI
jgi:hypothetical protein